MTNEKKNARQAVEEEAPDANKRARDEQPPAPEPADVSSESDLLAYRYREPDMRADPKRDARVRWHEPPDMRDRHIDTLTMGKAPEVDEPGDHDAEARCACCPAAAHHPVGRNWERLKAAPDSR